MEEHDLETELRMREQDQQLRMARDCHEPAEPTPPMLRDWKHGTWGL
jgi:hypothetical protein